jgi:hypothetical protein
MSSELVVNLWAIYDSSTGFVYSVAGKVYNTFGSDKEKLLLLKSLSATDYITAKRYPLPERFVVSFTDGTTKAGVTSLNVIYDLNAQVFEEVFKAIELELPSIPNYSSLTCDYTQLKLPENPLCVTTVLYEDEFGRIRPIITDKDREWIAWHEKSTHKP